MPARKIAEGTPAAGRAPIRRCSKPISGAGDKRRAAASAPIASAPRVLLDASALVAGYGARDVLRGADLEVARGRAGRGPRRQRRRQVHADARAVRLAAAGRRRGPLSRRAHRRISPGDRIARAGLVLVPEGRQVFPELSVTDNLRLGAYARRPAEEASMIENLLTRFPA